MTARDTLRFYANPNNYDMTGGRPEVMKDGGEKARLSLKLGAGSREGTAHHAERRREQEARSSRTASVPPVLRSRKRREDPWSGPRLLNTRVDLKGYSDRFFGRWALNSEAWTYEGDFRFLVLRRLVNNALLLVTFEQFKGFDATRITVAWKNAFAGTGAIVFDDLKVTYGGREISTPLEEGPHAIQPRGTFVRRYHVGPDSYKLEGYMHIEPVKGYPVWAPGMCLQGLQQQTTPANAMQIGPYTIGDPGVKGSSSLDGSHGGWEVGPYHFTAEGWQRCSRHGYRWAESEFFNTLARSPLAAYDPETLLPVNKHQPYWSGRASCTLDGFEEDLEAQAKVPYLKKLQGYEAPADSHAHRMTGSAAMLAPKDVFARIVLVEHYWHDFTLWLDGGESGLSYFQPYWQVIRDHSPHQGWSRGGRGFAHAVGCFKMAHPYLLGSKRGTTGDAGLVAPGQTWWGALRDLIRHVARLNGIVHSSGQDGKYPNVQKAVRSREVDLLYPGMVFLGLDDLAEKVRHTMDSEGWEGTAPEAWDGTMAHWSFGQQGGPSYYPPYDMIRGDLTTLRTDIPMYSSPSEQQISLVHPDLLLAAVAKEAA
jgi:hypothetical protein